jgi:electron transfer flavoprotein alpha subunit
MSSILLFVQQSEGKIVKASLVALTASLEIKDKHGKDSVSAVCLGKGAKTAAEEIAKFGVSKVFYSEASEVENYRPMAYSQASLKAIEESGADTFVLAATSIGKDFSARVSAKLQAGQLSDIVKVNDDSSFKRPLYAGNAFQDAKILTDKKVITVRGTAFDAASDAGSSAEVIELSVDFKLDNEVQYLELEAPESERPELADAEVVVSAGRAIQSTENIEKYIYPLADSLNAAIGASRAVVDAGYAPNDWQVGQTGKVVAPNLYIAVGISGAIQHVAGMKDSKVIVAINKDEDAPIFDIADYGLVADLYEVVEPLTEAIKASKS